MKNSKRKFFTAAAIFLAALLARGAETNLPPQVRAGVDRDVVLGGKTYLNGSVKFSEPDSSANVLWSKVSGPGKVIFANAETNVTTATFSKMGDYVLKFTAGDGKSTAASTLRVKVVAPPPGDRLNMVYTQPYQINSRLWNARAKALIVDWIPHCIDEFSETNKAHSNGGKERHHGKADPRDASGHHSRCLDHPHAASVVGRQQSMNLASEG